MTDERKELIERLAAECGIDIDADTLCRYEGWREPMERFAALIAEECARIADPWDDFGEKGGRIAADIRQKFKG